MIETVQNVERHVYSEIDLVQDTLQVSDQTVPELPQETREYVSLKLKEVEPKYLIRKPRIHLIFFTGHSLGMKLA
jgi:hypothetical protein